MDQLLTELRAMADQTRLRILLLVRHLELSVGEIVQILEQSQPRVSRHIRILDEAKLTERRKEGSWVFLRPGPALRDDRYNRLLDDAAGSAMMLADLERLELVRAERASMAERYFASHAEEWDQLRSMHVAESEVEDAMAALLEPSPIGRMLDIGTGTGRAIELFAERSAQFTALDNNGEMLRLARAKLAELVPRMFDASRVEIMLGDFNALPLADGGFDTVLLHQVLHYAPDPARVIGEAARVLRSGGRIMIVDFAAHDREELRSVHAHSRLGFHHAKIEEYFANCGIRLAQSRTLDGGELTVKIWLGRDISDARVSSENNNIRIVA